MYKTTLVVFAPLSLPFLLENIFRQCFFERLSDAIIVGVGYREGNIKNIKGPQK